MGIFILRIWICKKNISIILKNFYIDEMKPYKKYDDYCVSIVIDIFQEFVNEFPNNKLEFINEE